MLGSVTRRGRGSSAAWTALVFAGVNGTAAGCLGGPEVTTELREDAADEPSGPSMSSNPDMPSSSNPPSAGAAGAPARSRRETGPLPSGLSTSTPGTNTGAAPAVTPPANPEVPSGDYCAAVADWDAEWVQFEEEVLLLVNETRAKPADCGEDGKFAAAGPVVMDPVLRCSSRLHSLDMFERDFFDHTNPDGLDPFDRMSAAGFSGSGAAENIAVGQTSPKQVMQSWMDSDGHCANVMRGNYSLLGVGYHPGTGGRGLGSNYWTQNFGAAKSCTRNCR